MNPLGSNEIIRLILFFAKKLVDQDREEKCQMSGAIKEDQFWHKHGGKKQKLTGPNQGCQIFLGA
jgi:hypothetical protein